MSEQRLTLLALLSIERDFAEDVDAVIENFRKMSVRRGMASQI